MPPIQGTEERMNTWCLFLLTGSLIPLMPNGEYCTPGMCGRLCLQSPGFKSRLQHLLAGSLGK